MDTPIDTMEHIQQDIIITSLTNSINLRKIFLEIHTHIIEEQQRYIEVKTLWKRLGCQYNYPYYHQLLERLVMWELLNKIKTPNTNKLKYIIIDYDKWEQTRQKLQNKL